MVKFCASDPKLRVRFSLPAPFENNSRTIQFKYKLKLEKIKTIINSNLKVITPTEYQITYPATLTILEYKVNEISNKPFYIKPNNQKYNIKEITQLLKKF